MWRSSVPIAQETRLTPDQSEHDDKDIDSCLCWESNPSCSVYSHFRNYGIGNTITSACHFANI